MLRGFFSSGMVRGYSIFVSFVLQILLSKITSKSIFGEINAFLAAILLLTFFLSAAPTRKLIRELAAFGLAKRGIFADSLIGGSHVLILFFCIVAAFGSLVVTSDIWIIGLAVSLAYSAAIYSAFFRGIGRYTVGNIEAGAIRLSVFSLVLLVVNHAVGEVSLQTAQISFVGATLVGLVSLAFFRKRMPRLEFPTKNAWYSRRFPWTLTLLAGFDVFIVNYDLLVINFLYESEIAAETRIAQQLRSFTLLPLQIYLMFSFDKLSRSLQMKSDYLDREREMTIVRICIAATFATAIAAAKPFASLFFTDGIDFILTICVLSGIIPIILFGPKTESIIAASAEVNQGTKTTIFFLFYVMTAPILSWLFSWDPHWYFLLQTLVITTFFACLPRKI